MKKNIILTASLVLGLAAAVLLFHAATEKDEAPPKTFLIHYADSSYARAPEKADLAVPPTENETFLDSVLKTIFANGATLSDEEKSIRILKHVSSVLPVKDNIASASSLLRHGYALCYGRSKVFITLCRMVGLPARHVGSMYMPDLKTHAISEVFYGGRWHLFDATFGIFFYSSLEYGKEGYVISFHDLVSNPLAWTPFMVVPEAGTGVYDESVRSYPVTRIEDEQVELAAENISLASYRRGIQKAYPVAYGGNDIVSYPVDANLLRDSSRWFGRLDRSSGDLAGFHERFSGSQYVGHASPPGFHTWLIHAPPFSTVYIEYHSVYSNMPKLHLVPLRSATILEAASVHTKATFTIRVIDSTAIVSVFCPVGSFSVDAMHIYR